MNNLSFIKQGLEKGQCTPLVGKMDSYSNLSSLLQFSNKFSQSDKNLHNKLQKFDPNTSNDFQYEINKPKVLDENEFDEEQNEINFNQNPQIYRDISYGIQTQLLTNSPQNAVLAQEIQIDHKYSQQFFTQLQNQEEQLELVKQKDIGLLIYDFRISNKNLQEVVQGLQIVDNLLQKFHQNYQLYNRLVISPIFQESIKTEQVLNYQQQKQNLDQNVLDLIPTQTRDYSIGQIKQSGNQDNKQFSLSIYFEEEQNRTDNIIDFTQLLNFEQIMDNINNGTIDINCMYREIIFKSGKLPKFGA